MSQLVLQGDAIAIFDRYENETVLLHGCNSQTKMFKGFADSLRKKWNGVYEADLNFHLPIGRKRLGNYSYYRVNDKKTIINCYIQEFYGSDGKKYMSYDALDEVLSKLSKRIKKDTTIIYPKIGSDLAGGNWSIINGFMCEYFKNHDRHILVEYKK